MESVVHLRNQLFAIDHRHDQASRTILSGSMRSSAHMALRATQGGWPGDIRQERVLGMSFRGHFAPCTLNGGGAGTQPAIGDKS